MTSSSAPKLDGRVRRAQEARRERREKVLEAALRVFAKKGYHATSIADIIDAAGIARGTFYLYFESKRAIFAELLEDLFKTLAREVRTVDIEPGAKAPIVQLQEIVRHVLATLHEHRDLTRILLREAVGLDDDFDQKLKDFYGRILPLVRHALETGQQLGLVRPCDVKVTSLCILGSVKELVDQILVQAQPKDVDLDMLVSQILDFNLNGVFQK